MSESSRTARARVRFALDCQDIDFTHELSNTTANESTNLLCCGPDVQTSASGCTRIRFRGMVWSSTVDEFLLLDLYHRSPISIDIRHSLNEIRDLCGSHITHRWATRSRLLRPRRRRAILVGVVDASPDIVRVCSIPRSLRTLEGISVEPNLLDQLTHVQASCESPDSPILTVPFLLLLLVGVRL